MDSYFPILLLMGLALLLGIGILITSHCLGPKNPLAAKLSPYECGVSPEGSPHARFSSRFYIVAVMFLLLDVEAAFFFPWALVYRESLAAGPTLFVALIIYLGIFVVGLYFIIKKDCLRLK